MQGLEDQTLETLLQRERERLETRREEILEERRKLDEVLDSIDREFAAIEAYEAAKTGRPSKGRRTGARAPRGEKRAKILEVLATSSEGMSRREIIEAMGVKGDKSGEASVSNALTALKRAHTIRHSDDGKYLAP